MYREVSLPAELMQAPHSLLQDSSALGVSSATAALYAYIKQNFSNNPQRVLEAGSSSGILCLMLKLAMPMWDIFGLEIQAELHHLAIANAENLKLQLSFVNTDLRSFHDISGFDLIISNPPWQKLGHGLISPNVSRAMCRTELCCTLPDILAFCSRNLSAGKHAVLLYPASRKQELIQEAYKQQMRLLYTTEVEKSSLIFHLEKGQ